MHLSNETSCPKRNCYCWKEACFSLFHIKLLLICICVVICFLGYQASNLCKQISVNGFWLYSAVVVVRSIYIYLSVVIYIFETSILLLATIMHRQPSHSQTCDIFHFLYKLFKSCSLSTFKRAQILTIYPHTLREVLFNLNRKMFICTILMARKDDGIQYFQSPTKKKEKKKINLKKKTR